MPKASGDPTYNNTPVVFTKKIVFANYNLLMSSINIPIIAEMTTLYWIPNFHKYLYMLRHIASSSICSTKELCITMTTIVSAIIL